MERKFKREREWFPSLKEKEEQESLRGIVPKEERWRKSPNNKIFVLEFQDKDVREAMTKITELANLSTPEKIEDRCLYQRILVRVYEKISSVLIQLLKKEKTSKPFLFFAPRRGGELPEKMFKKAIESFPEISIKLYKIQLARIQKELLGVKEIIFEPSPPDLKKISRTIIIFDDCIASTVSIEALFDLIKEFSNSQGVSLSEFRILIGAAAATQRGLERLLQIVKEKYGFKDVKIVVGILVFRMNSQFYLVVPNNPKIYVVGDMGNWTEKLPEGFNDEAPWNKFRE